MTNQIEINKQNIDGSVNSYQETKILGHGYHIPFDAKNFDTQIEKNIYNAVLLLNLRGYKTITSCQGHSRFDKIFNNGLRVNAGPQITVEVLNSEVEKFQKHFKTFFITTDINLTIEMKTNDSTYISIFPKSFIRNFLTNKFFCNKITELCETLFYEHIN